MNEQPSWNRAMDRINAAGQIPIPVTDTAIELIQTIMTEEQADLCVLQVVWQ
jgi:hypothetical protein